MKKSQTTLEYFILFSVLAGLTLLSANSFLPKVKNTAQGLSTNAIRRILDPSSSNLPVDGNTPKSGEWSDEIKIATKLNQPAGDSGYYGYTLKNGEITLHEGQTRYFLIDPAAIDPNIKNIRISILDFAQGDNLSARVITVDQNGNELKNVPFRFEEHNQGAMFIRGYQPGQMYLIELSWPAGVPYRYNWPAMYVSVFWNPF